MGCFRDRNSCHLLSKPNSYWWKWKGFIWVFLTLRPVLSFTQNRTLVCLHWLRAYTIQTHQHVSLLLTKLVLFWAARQPKVPFFQHLAISAFPKVTILSVSSVQMLVHCETHKSNPQISTSICLDYRDRNRPWPWLELTDWIGIPKGFQSHNSKTIQH